MNAHIGPSGKLAHAFIDSKLTPLIVLAAMGMGAFAVILIPREEDPQIIVPMIDIFVQAPGMTAKEVEERVTKPMEKLLWEIPGVEYIYSTSSPGHSMVILRFYVGEDETSSILKTYNKMYSNFDLIPPGVSQPLIKPRWIDDVPILALTLWSDHYNHFQLRRMAARLHDYIKQCPDTSEVHIIGGERRQLRVTLDPSRLEAFHIAPAVVAERLQQANQQLAAGSFAAGNTEFAVETGDFLRSKEDVGRVVAGVFSGRPVYVRDVAQVTDGPEEPRDYVFISHGPAAEAVEGSEGSLSGVVPAVTISVAKRKGKNAAVIANRAIRKLEQVKGVVIPSDVNVTITRNYGETATDKSNELLKHLAIAVLSVTLLIALALGWRESGVVLVAIPVTLALTLLVFYLYHYTLNRVTLFALIFSIGILVDDAIVVVENIVRHFRLPENKGRSLSDVAVEAVDEVGNPTILATFAVIAAIVPMAFVRGLMGPYMRPIPVGASAAMIFSLLIAFIISPWASLRLLRKEAAHPAKGHTGEREGWTTRIYRSFMGSMIRHTVARWAFLATCVVLLLGACSLVYFKIVAVKMLPFDNKSEFQIIINMPEGTPLEKTSVVARQISEVVTREPEVTNCVLYVGTASPYNFNGLVRHYFLRRGPNVADLHVNLVPKDERKTQSHDIAKRVRRRIKHIGEKWGAVIEVSEVPPGPPVLQTLVAEIYGPDYGRQIEVARQVRDVFESTPGVVDVDWYVEAEQPKYRFVVDKEKAALNGISADQVVRSLRIAVDGMGIGLAHMPGEKEDVLIFLRLPRAARSSLEGLKQIPLQSDSGALVRLGEVADIQETVTDRNIYHKNLMPVVYVTGDVAGREESPVYAILNMNKALDKITLAEGYNLKRYTTRQPSATSRYAMKWDGEWHITYEVFRDLGLAFACVLLIIYVLIVGWFKSFVTPIVIMAVIPISLVGILPGHALMGAFFTATSMIGFIAGAGIVVRNSIILVDFIELRLRHGDTLSDAVIEAGAVRFRPMLLTAAAVIVGASVILFDPIFQGLAISLMAGEVASLFLSRMAVPILYYMANRRRSEIARAADAEESDENA